MSPSPLRLVVLDWDGTLVDSIGTIVACTLAAVDEVPGAPRPAAELIRDCVGLGIAETMERLFPTVRPELVEQVAQAYRRLWRGGFRDRVELLSGAAEAVRALAGDGLFLAVATAKSRAGLERELQTTRLAPFFLAARTVDEAPSKPAPEMLFQLFDELGVSPTEALMVGDTAWDLEMARNAGCASVAVLSGGHGRDRLESANPLVCLDSVAELPGWLADAGLGRATG